MGAPGEMVAARVSAKVAAKVLVVSVAVAKVAKVVTLYVTIVANQGTFHVNAQSPKREEAKAVVRAASQSVVSGNKGIAVTETIAVSVIYDRQWPIANINHLIHESRQCD